jgi:hypothetical protein
VNSIKQAAEFGIVAGGQRLAAFALTAADWHASAGAQVAMWVIFFVFACGLCREGCR